MPRTILETCFPLLYDFKCVIWWGCVKRIFFSSLVFLDCIVLYCIVLYCIDCIDCIVLYCIVLYIILYSWLFKIKNRKRKNVAY